MSKSKSMETKSVAAVGIHAVLADLVSRVIARLESPSYPKDGICSHHGLRFVCGDDDIGFAEHNGLLLITIYRGNSKYQEKENGEIRVVGYSKKEHCAKMRAVAAATGCAVHKYWNGKSGHDGVSICLARPCPASLEGAIANYRMLPDVFSLTEAERARRKRFHSWVNAEAIYGATSRAQNTNQQTEN